MSEDKAKQLAEFTAGYIQSLLWSSHESIDDGDGTVIELEHCELSAEGQDKCAAECLAFFNANYDDLTRYAAQRQIHAGNGTAWAHAGHDFALTRNGHGAGFWDREELDPMVGRNLTKASEDACGMVAYLGDDGKVYVCKG